MAEGHSGVSLGSLVPRDSDVRSQAYEEHVLITVRAITMERSLHIGQGAFHVIFSLNSHNKLRS